MPASLFDESGAMHAQSKAVLKTKLQVEQSSRIHGVADVDIIDICVMLGSVRSPTSGTVEDYIINFTVAIKYYLERGDIYQIFDRDLHRKQYTADDEIKSIRQRCYSKTSTQPSHDTASPERGSQISTQPGRTD